MVVGLKIPATDTFGFRVLEPGFLLMLPPVIGYLPNLAGRGYQTMHGVGLPSTMAGGILTQFMVGYGCLIQCGDQHGSHGVVHPAIMDGHQWNPAGILTSLLQAAIIFLRIAGSLFPTATLIVLM